MLNKIKSFCLVIVLLLLTACSQDLVLEQKTVVLAGETFNLEIVSDSLQQNKGLSGRKSLEPNQGMLFIYPEKRNLSFWMKDMNFDIDLLWLVDGRIVGKIQNMPKPSKDTLVKDLPSYTSPEAVNQVLELPAGTIQRLKLEVGQELFSE